MSEYLEEPCCGREATCKKKCYWAEKEQGRGAFVTHDSGEETQFSSGMKRDSNKGKPRFDLIVPEGVPYKDQLLTRFAALMARGAELRGDRNWENANSEADLARFRESAFRHFFQWYCGETDEDHLVGFLFNAQGAEFVKGKLDFQKLMASKFSN